MFEKILVTGGAGFVGQRLVAQLEQTFPAAVIISPGVDLPPCDVSDADAVEALLSQHRPDAVINLAAISHIPTSFSQPELTWSVNLGGTLNLLRSAQSVGLALTFIQVGSGDCYGESFKSGRALTEDAAFKPMNPYSASKAAADLAAFSLRSDQLKVIRARPFNHTAAGQSSQFVVSAFAEQLAKIEAGLQDPIINVGDLSAHRCFLHCDDVISAYIELLKSSQEIDSGTAFNICSPAPVSMQAMLDCLLSLSDIEVEAWQDPSRMRPTDIPFASGDSSLLIEKASWQMKYSLESILLDVLSGWRHHYQKK